MWISQVFRGQPGLYDTCLRNEHKTKPKQAKQKNRLPQTPTNCLKDSREQCPTLASAKSLDLTEQLGLIGGCLCLRQPGHSHGRSEWITRPVPGSNIFIKWKKVLILLGANIPGGEQVELVSSGASNLISARLDLIQIQIIFVLIFKKNVIYMSNVF